MKPNKIFSLAYVSIIALGLFACEGDQPLPPTQTPSLPTLTPTTALPADNPKTITPANADEVVELQRMGYGMVTELDISPDDSMLAVASTTGVQVYDLDTLEMIFKSDDVWSDSVDWSPEGRFLVSAHYDGSLNLWDAATGELLLSQKTPYNPIVSVAWSPDGQKIATNGTGFTLIWDAKTLELIAEYGAPRDSWIEWTSNSKYLAFHDYSPTIYFLDIVTGEVVASYEDDIQPHIGDDYFINGANPGALVVLKSKEESKYLTGDGFSKVFYRVEGEELLYSNGPSLMKYNVVSQEDIPLMDYDWTKFSRLMEWNSDLTIFISGGINGNIVLVDLTTGGIHGEIPGYFYGLDMLVWAPDNNKLGISSTSNSQNVFIWDLEKNDLYPGISKFFEWSVSYEGIEERKYVEIHDIANMIWSSENELIVANGNNYLYNGLLLWNALTGEVVLEREGDTIIGKTYISPDGKYIAVQRTKPNILNVIDIEYGESVFSKTLRNYGRNQFSWSMDSQLLVIYCAKVQTMRVWDVARDIVLNKWSVDLPIEKWLSPNDLSILSFSNENAFLAGRNRVGDLWIWDVDTGEIRYSIEGGTERFESSITWSPVMPLLAFNTPEGLVIWDIDTNQQVALLTGFNGGIVDIAWSPDGAHIATIGEDHTIRIWGIGEK